MKIAGYIVGVVCVLVIAPLAFAVGVYARIAEWVTRGRYILP